MLLSDCTVYRFTAVYSFNDLSILTPTHRGLAAGPWNLFEISASEKLSPRRPAEKRTVKVWAAPEQALHAGDPERRSDRFDAGGGDPDAGGE